MRLHPYPDYKDSGLPWSGNMPAHWHIQRGKWLFRQMQRSTSATDEVVTCFRDGIVTLRKNRRTTGFTESLKEIGYQGVRRGDLVIHAMDAFAGAVGVSDSDGKCTPVYAVCQPVAYVDAHYYAHVAREMARTQWILALARGIRERSTDFRFDTFANQPLPLPPFQEQKAIAAFITYQDQLINRLIRAKRRLITLLNEQKQAIIQRAVTRGLNPDLPLKSSGVEWLGDVPEGWSVHKLKHLVVEPLKYGANEAAELIDRALPRYIRITDIDNAGNLSDGTFRSLPAELAKPYLLMEGDLLFARSGATSGKTFLYHAEHGAAAYAGYLIHARVSQRKIRPQFLYLYVQSPSYWSWILLATIQATIQNVSAGKYANLPVPLPSLLEQDKIIEHVTTTSLPFELAISRAKREINLIREYRARLIADVVTGKLDVRGVQLPADGYEAEAEMLDDLQDEPDEAEDVLQVEEAALAVE